MIEAGYPTLEMVSRKQAIQRLAFEKEVEIVCLEVEVGLPRFAFIYSKK